MDLFVKKTIIMQRKLLAAIIYLFIILFPLAC